MKKKFGVFAIILLMVALLPGLAGIASAAFPVAITGYVGVNNTPGSPMVTPLSGWTVTLKKSPYTSTAATATTSSAGLYSLSVTSALGAGTYRVYETVKSGYKNYTVDYAQFTVSSTSTGLKANFTNYQLPAVTLNGHKYQDPDGKHTSTATPLSGWTIQLNKSSGTKWSTLATATTDATGTYQFQVTDYGNYRVVEVEQAGYQKTWPATNYSQTIKGGQTGTITQDFWNAKLMSVKVSGHTYEDPDLAHTSTATPLAGWKVHLQNLSGTTWNEIASATTATGTGYYEFLNIKVPGSYRVLEDLQTGYLQSYPANGIISFTLDANSPAQAGEFWNYKVPGVVISGHKFLDPDGLHTSKASPLGGWKIHLQNLSGTTWNEVASATTAAGTGYYEFPPVKVPGSYRILEDAVTGYSQSYPVSPYTYSVKSGQTAPVPDQDFWNSKLMNVRISGHKYEDPDLTHTSTATPLKNWGMHLSLLSGTTWTEVGTTKTADDGSYEFTSITQPGHYRVWEDPDPAYRSSSPADGKIEFDLDAFSADQTADFWDYRLPSVVITGYSYLDPDGQHTSKATPLGGWEVKLLKGSGNPVTWSEVASVKTDKNGYYGFPPVTEIGNYQVTEVVQDGYEQTYPVSVSTYQIMPGQADALPEQNFWNTKLMNVGISGHKYEDPDLTHTSTATPLKNRVMHLSILSGSPETWTEVGTTATDKDGYYQFTPVTQPGHYRVWGDSDPSHKPSSPVDGKVEFDLDSDSPGVTADFWDYRLPYVVIWGFSYLDPDGQHISQDTPLEGWEIKLLKAEGDPVTWVQVESVTTEKHGYYQFNPVTDVGNYRIVEMVQEGYIQTYPESSSSFLITPGQTATITDQDFWNSKLMSVRISGHAFEDSDGTQTLTTTPLKLWQIHLALWSEDPAAWNEIGTATTDKDGYYEFTPVTQPGHYQVWEDPDPAYKPSSPADGKVEYDLDSGSPGMTVDFWNARLPYVMISGHNYLDPDGQHISRDTPLEGWEFRLLKAGRDPGTWVEVDSAATDKQGFYGFRAVTDAGTYLVAGVAQEGYTQTYPSSANTIVIRPGQVDPIEDQDFWNKKIGGDPDPDPDPVPVPEFPTVAVSVFTIVGMIGAVQFLKAKGLK